MSDKFLYLYLVAGVIFVGMVIYDWGTGNVRGFSIIYDLVIALFLFYRAYRIYKTKNDQELM